MGAVVIPYADFQSIQTRRLAVRAIVRSGDTRRAEDALTKFMCIPLGDLHVSRVRARMVAKLENELAWVKRCGAWHDDGEAA
jgi:hypothetical protein